MRAESFHLDSGNGFEPFEFATPGWHAFTKPRGARLIYLRCFGAGGGGGGGFTRASGVAGGGGGGGVYGSGYYGWCPASQFPDVVYVYVGEGGAGGAASSDGTAGEHSGIAVALGLTNANLIASAGALGAAGGQPGRGGAATSPGNPGNPNANTSSAWFRGHTSVYTGGNGSPGGYPTPGNGTLNNNVASTTGGLGGGGVTVGDVGSAGGSLSGTLWASTFLVPGGAAGGGRGGDGIEIRKPVRIWTGGSGGGGSGLTPGGDGGDAAANVGGGGGGGAGTTGGRGGRGGHGYVLIGVA